jgi:hypothetical protein
VTLLVERKQRLSAWLLFRRIGLRKAGRALNCWMTGYNALFDDRASSNSAGAGAACRSVARTTLQ